MKELSLTRVGDDLLPELPPGWNVTVDTEGSGLFVDGEPFATGSRPPAPEARISVVSITFRRPVWDDAENEWKPGDRVDYAWAFDQGPVLGKPGVSHPDPETAGISYVFAPITEADQRKLLAKFSEHYGQTITLAEACPNLAPDHYAALIAWLDRRDSLTMHNSIHDMHQFRVGLRADAGGFGGEEGFAAWDPDSEPGCWRLGEPQRLHMMEPTLEPLTVSPVRRTIHCTMLVQKQIAEPLEMSALKKTAKRLWGEDEGTELEELEKELALLKVVGPRLHKRYDLLPFCGAMKRYAADDTNKTDRLEEHQNRKANDEGYLPGFWRLYQIEMETRTTLYRMERRGVAYDAENSLKEGNRLLGEMRAASDALPYEPKTNAIKRFYFGLRCAQSQSRVEAGGQLLCAKDCAECGGKNGLGVVPKYRTPTGQPQLTEAVLEEFTQEGHPWCAELARYLKLRNSVSKWYIGWGKRVGRDGRIRTSFKQCKADYDRAGSDKGGTKSGRLAVGRWQAQAIPHGRLIPEGAEPVRGYIGREEGYELYEHDLKTGELRVVTVIAGVDSLWDALDNGLDAHGMNARAFFKEKGEPDHPLYEQVRDAAKRGTFGILYGGTARGIKPQMEEASGLKISLREVEEAIESFFDAYPEFLEMTREAEWKVTRWKGGPGYLTMLDGWRRWYAYDEKTNSAVNQVIQGNLARAMLQWMAAVEREIPGVLLLQIHDSLVTRHRKGPEGAEEAQRVSDIGERVFRKYFDVRGRIMNFGIKPDKWKAEK